MNTTQALRPQPRSTIRQQLRPLLPAGVAAGALALAGCGTVEIDPKKAESSIRSSVAAAGNQLASASCPKGIKPKKGDTFNCSFRLTDSRHGMVTIAITSDKGDIHIDPSAYHLQ